MPVTKKFWIAPVVIEAAREHGLTYSQFINGLGKAGVEIDRKILSDLAVREPDSFKTLVEQAQTALAKNA